MNRTNEKLFREFTKRMKERIEMGERKYKGAYLDKDIRDIVVDIHDEVLDLSVYSMFLYEKVKKFEYIGSRRKTNTHLGKR